MNDDSETETSILLVSQARKVTVKDIQEYETWGSPRYYNTNFIYRRWESVQSVIRLSLGKEQI